MNPKTILFFAFVLTGVLIGRSSPGQRPGPDEPSTPASLKPGFPILPPITDTNPSISGPLQVHVPSRLKIERTSDWVAGFKEPWNPDPALPTSAGNRQLLEMCATVEQAIAFFHKHRELGLYTARVLVADRTGASAIIGAKDGKLQVEKSSRCHGFGYGEQTLDLKLALRAFPTVTNGVSILRACLQKGEFATKYSNIFDLKSGDVFLLPFPDRNDRQVKFNLAAELKKGGHYYDMPEIREQLLQAPRPLLANMERSLLNKYQPIPDKEPQVTAHVRALWQDVLDDTMRAKDYTEETWKEASVTRKLADATIKSLGRLVSLTLVDRSDENGKRCYRYRVVFEKNTILARYVFDEVSIPATVHDDFQRWIRLESGKCSRERQQCPCHRHECQAEDQHNFSVTQPNQNGEAETPNKSLEPTAAPRTGLARLPFRAAGSSTCGSAWVVRL
jgi:hypothetical protein